MIVFSVDEEVEVEVEDAEEAGGGGGGGILKPSLSIVVAGGFFLTFCASSGDNFRLRGDSCCCSVLLPLVWTGGAAKTKII